MERCTKPEFDFETTKLAEGLTDSMGAALNRLAQYEDTEEQGLLVRLPCKVGAAAFVLEVENKDGGEERIFEGEVISFSLADGQAYATIGNMERDCWFSETERRLSDIGIDWFLTREEAEKVLKEAKQNG